MIYVLPQLNLDNLILSLTKRIEAAKTSTYRIDSLKSLFDIEYMDLKYLLHYNTEFFEHTMKVADKIVIQMLHTWKDNLAKSECKESYELLKDANTLNDLLYSCNYFGDNDESRRSEFIDAFAESLDNFEEYFA